MKPSELALLFDFYCKSGTQGDLHMTMALENRCALAARAMREAADSYIEAYAQLELHRCIRQMKSEGLLPPWEKTIPAKPEENP